MLSGIKVLDFTSNIAGPCAGALLADLGARVIHIERPLIGDDNRNWAEQADGTCSSHFVLNRSKESLVLNLKDPRAQKIALELAKDADIVIESNKPGSMDKMGLGYEAMKAVNPGIIYCSISAFGQTGPYSARAGYDIIAQAYSGFMYYTTAEDGGKPTKITPEVGDYVASINAFGNIMAALYYRQNTGKGQYIDIALTRGLISMLGPFSHPYTGKVSRKRLGNVSATLCPYGLFEYDKDTYVAIGAANNALFKRLFTVMGRENMANDPTYATVPLRARSAKVIYAAIEAWLQSFASVYDAIAILEKNGIPCNKVMSMEDLEHDKHALSCGWIREIPTPESVTSRPQQLAPIGIASLSEQEIVVRPAPDLGQHSIAILGEIGMTEEEAEALEREWEEQARQALKR